MKSPKSILALVVLALLSTGLAFAGDDKKESKAAGCCARAEKDGKACTHECCAAAAKDGNNCAKCKGSIPSARSFLTIVIARCAKRAVAIQLDCFVATLLAMTAKS
jgi:hypothetical protein